MTSYSELEVSTAWNDAPYLVVRRKASKLPDRCIRCNAPAAQWMRFALKKSLSLTESTTEFLVGTQSLMLAHYLFAERVHLRPALCDGHWKEERRHRRRPAVMLLVALGLALFVAVCFDRLMKVAGAWPPLLLILAAVCLVLIALFYSILRPKPLRAIKVDRHFGWVTGVSPEFLENLPNPPKS